MGSLGSDHPELTDDPPHHGPLDDPPKHASGPLDDAIRPLHHQHFQITLQYAEVRSIDPNRRLPLARRTFPFLSVTEGKNLATPLSIRLPESYAGVHGVMCMTRAGCDRTRRIGCRPVAIDVDRNGSELPPRPRDPRVPPSPTSRAQLTDIAHRPSRIDSVFRFLPLLFPGRWLPRRGASRRARPCAWRRAARWRPGRARGRCK